MTKKRSIKLVSKILFHLAQFKNRLFTEVQNVTLYGIALDLAISDYNKQMIRKLCDVKMWKWQIKTWIIITINDNIMRPFFYIDWGKL
jgi:hypothetical protein